MLILFVPNLSLPFSYPNRGEGCGQRIFQSNAISALLDAGHTVHCIMPALNTQSVDSHIRLVCQKVGPRQIFAEINQLPMHKYDLVLWNHAVSKRLINALWVDKCVVFWHHPIRKDRKRVQKLRLFSNLGGRVAFLTNWHRDQAIKLLGYDSSNWLVVYNDIADYTGDAQPHNNRLAIVSRNVTLKRIPFMLDLCLEAGIPCDVFTNETLLKDNSVGQTYYNIAHDEIMLRLQNYAGLLHACKCESSGIVFTEAAVRGLPSIHCSPAGHEKLRPIGGMFYADYYAEELNHVFLANSFRLALDAPRQSIAKNAQMKFSPEAFVQRIKSLR